MRTLYRWKVVIAVLMLLVLAGIHSSAMANGPYEGRNFRFPVKDSDVVTVTFTDPLPVTSADTYFDIIIDGGFYGEGVAEGQRVYTINWSLYPDSTEPFIFALGTYGTISLNGVLQPTFDNELIQGVQSVNLLVYGPGTSQQILPQTYVYTTDPVLSEKWSTLEYLPSNFVGLTQAQIDQISADLAAATQVGYAFVFNASHTLTLPCTSGSFTITPRVSLGPDNFRLGAPQIVPCTGAPMARITRADTGVVIANGSTFTFPDTDVAQLPIVQAFNLCNDGAGTWSLSTPLGLVSGTGFSQAGLTASSIDPGTCATLTVRFTATLPGTYNGHVSLYSNIPSGLTGFNLRATATVAGPQMHIQSQTITRQGSLFVKATDQVLVTDQNNQPVPGVLVTGIYSGPTQGQVSGTTGSNGKANLVTNSALRPRNKWCFTITSLSKAGYVYNPPANVVTTKCE
jgi:hypothetical protein